MHMIAAYLTPEFHPAEVCEPAQANFNTNIYLQSRTMMNPDSTSVQWPRPANAASTIYRCTPLRRRSIHAMHGRDTTENFPSPRTSSARHRILRANQRGHEG